MPHVRRFHTRSLRMDSLRIFLRRKNPRMSHRRTTHQTTTPTTVLKKEPIYWKAINFHSYGSESPIISHQLQGLLFWLGVTKAPEYHI
jgi:hypothetical protein